MIYSPRVRCVQRRSRLRKGRVRLRARPWAAMQSSAGWASPSPLPRGGGWGGGDSPQGLSSGCHCAIALGVLSITAREGVWPEEGREIFLTACHDPRLWLGLRDTPCRHPWGSWGGRCPRLETPADAEEGQCSRLGVGQGGVLVGLLSLVVPVAWQLAPPARREEGGWWPRLSAGHAPSRGARGCCSQRCALPCQLRVLCARPLARDPFISALPSCSFAQENDGHALARARLESGSR